MRIFERRFSLTPIEKWFDHPADDRARTDDRHLHDDVVKLRRRIAGQRRHLRAALDLEHAHRVGLVEHLVDAFVVLRQMSEIDIDAFIRADERDHFFDRREHAEAEEVDFDDAKVGAVVFVPLDHDPAGHGCRLQRHDFIETPFRHHHTAGVLAEVTRQILNLHLQAHEVLHAQIGWIEACAGQLLRHRLDALTDLAKVPGAERFRKFAGLFEREAERFANFTRRRFIAIGDDVRGHRRSVNAVRLVDVLDDALALIARRQIEIDMTFDRDRPK